MKISTENQPLFSDIYGSENYRNLVNHLKKSLNKPRTADVKRELSTVTYNDLTMYPEITGRILKGISIIVKNEPDTKLSTTKLANSANSLIQNAEQYRKYLEDPDLLKEINFKHVGSEILPICGEKVDCYEGFINNQKAGMKTSLLGLQIIENFGKFQKETFLNFDSTQILFTKTNKLGVEQIFRKVSRILGTNIRDWIKLYQKL